MQIKKKRREYYHTCARSERHVELGAVVTVEVGSTALPLMAAFTRAHGCWLGKGREVGDAGHSICGTAVQCGRARGQRLLAPFHLRFRAFKLRRTVSWPMTSRWIMGRQMACAVCVSRRSFLLLLRRPTTARVRVYVYRPPGQVFLLSD